MGDGIHALLTSYICCVYVKYYNNRNQQTIIHLYVTNEILYNEKPFLRVMLIRCST